MSRCSSLSDPVAATTVRSVPSMTWAVMPIAATRSETAATSAGPAELRRTTIIGAGRLSGAADGTGGAAGRQSAGGGGAGDEECVRIAGRAERRVRAGGGAR